MPIPSGALSLYTSVEENFFSEAYDSFNRKNKDIELFKIIDDKDGIITYYVLTSFLANQ